MHTIPRLKVKNALFANIKTFSALLMSSRLLSVNLQPPLQCYNTRDNQCRLVNLILVNFMASLFYDPYGSLQLARWPSKKMHLFWAKQQHCLIKRCHAIYCTSRAVPLMRGYKHRRFVRFNFSAVISYQRKCDTRQRSNFPFLFSIYIDRINDFIIIFGLLLNGRHLLPAEIVILPPNYVCMCVYTYIHLHTHMYFLTYFSMGKLYLFIKPIFREKGQVMGNVIRKSNKSDLRQCFRARIKMKESFAYLP